MPTELKIKLPKFTRTRKVGNASEDYLSSYLGKFDNVIKVPNQNDQGIDFICEQITDDEQPNGNYYFVQCKGIDKTQHKNGTLSVKIKVTTINYWLITRRPVLLIVVDEKNHCFYWAYPYDQVQHRLKEIQAKKSIIIKVSVEQRINHSDNQLPSQILDIIEEYDPDKVLKELYSPANGAIEVSDIFDLYKAIHHLKSREDHNLDYVNPELLQYAKHVRSNFDYFFVTSEIRIWYKYTNQLRFSLFKKTESGRCFFIGNIIVLSGAEEGSVDHLVELANRSWLDTKGDIMEMFDDIVKYLNRHY